MLPSNRILSSVLLIAGIVLVFAGLSAALGLTVAGVLASLTAIATLLYAGSAWFGPPPPLAVQAGAETVLVFDRDLHVIAGTSPGGSLLSRFPAATRPAIEARCRAALRGESSRFVCNTAGARLVVETAPLASVTGVVLYGTLIASTGVAVPMLTGQPATTIA